VEYVERSVCGQNLGVSSAFGEGGGPQKAWVRMAGLGYLKQEAPK